MIRGRGGRAIGLALLLAAVAAAPAPAEAQQRPMEVEDLFALQELGELAISPDGQWLAVVVKRPQKPGERYDVENLMRNEHADIWLVPTAGDAAPVNLTDGAQDGGGYWGPVWSPDGRRLAMLSTRDGDNVRGYVLDLETRALTRLDDGGVDPGARILVDGAGHTLVWLDATTITMLVLPEGEVPDRFDSQRRTPRLATEAWARTHRGVEPAVSVIESGAGAAHPVTVEERLVVVDVETGAARTAAQGSFLQVVLDDDRTAAALIARSTLLHPEPDRPLVIPHPITSRFGVVDLNGHRSGARWVEDVVDPWRLVAFRPGAAAAQVAWSPDGRTVAVVGRGGDGGQVQLVPVDPGEVRIADPPGVRVQGVDWSADGRLLVRGPAVQSHEGDSARPRAEWWRVHQEGTGWVAHAFTRELPAAPDVLLPLGTDRFLALVEGDIWAVSMDGDPANLTAATNETIQRVVGGPWTVGGSTESTGLIVRSARGREGAFHRVTVTAGAAQAETLASPHPSAELRVASSDGRALVYTAATPGGNFVWTRTGSEPWAQRLALNEFLAEIQDPDRLLLRYAAPSGDSLSALLALPPAVAPGEPVPTVVWVYGGSMQRDTVSGSLLKDRSFYLNLNLLTGQGYGVLIPSLPLPRYGVATDPLGAFPELTLLAVDRAVETGLVDPDRLALMGYSYGGYTTKGIVAATHRFQAAIAVAGPSELVGMYGTFDARVRYTDTPHHALFGTAMTEAGQMRMGGPPWSDPDRYLRNSPFMLADRIETPLMLVYGDLDAVPIEQGEAMFIALYRQGKRASFVRYWGEGHGIQSPANVRDFWTRVHDWLEEHLDPGKGGGFAGGLRR